MRSLRLSRPVDEVMVAMPTAGGTVVRAVVEHCRRRHPLALVMPASHELLDGQVSVNLLRNVEIGDLLRRPSRVPTAAPISGSGRGDHRCGRIVGSELARPN